MEGTSPEEYYKTLAPIYDKLYQNSVPYKEGYHFIDSLRKKYGLEKSVLDVAVGTGELLKHFEKAEYITYGSDLTQAMIDIAKTKLRQTELKKSDYKDIDFSRQFDIIVSFFNSFSYTVHIDRFKDVLYHLKNQMKKGGLLIFDIVTTTSPEEIFTTKELRFENMHISRTFYGWPNDKVYHSTMTYTIIDRLTKETKLIKATTIRGLFSTTDIENLIKNVGLELVDPGEGYADYTTFVAKKS
jgi:ubiquinone/menaquinone biosynthesis C-methylase UbiE